MYIFAQSQIDFLFIITEIGNDFIFTHYNKRNTIASVARIQSIQTRNKSNINILSCITLRPYGRAHFDIRCIMYTTYRRARAKSGIQCISRLIRVAY